MIALRREKIKLSPRDVEKIIVRVAREENVLPEIALLVAKCESSLNPRATNENPNGTVDRGVFQWNKFYHPEVTDQCAYDVECATREFCKAFLKGKLWWWKATQDCWSK